MGGEEDFRSWYHLPLHRSWKSSSIFYRKIFQWSMCFVEAPMRPLWVQDNSKLIKSISKLPQNSIQDKSSYNLDSLQDLYFQNESSMIDNQSSQIQQTSGWWESPCWNHHEKDTVNLLHNKGSYLSKKECYTFDQRSLPNWVVLFYKIKMWLPRLMHLLTRQNT